MTKEIRKKQIRKTRQWRNNKSSIYLERRPLNIIDGQEEYFKWTHIKLENQWNDFMETINQIQKQIQKTNEESN